MIARRSFLSLLGVGPLALAGTLNQTGTSGITNQAVNTMNEVMRRSDE